jgi:hypothetical protein
MTARIYAHPTVTGDDIHRLYREHSLVAVARPAKVGRQRRFVVEMRPLARPTWLAPTQQAGR